MLVAFVICVFMGLWISNRLLQAEYMGLGYTCLIMTFLFILYMAVTVN